MKRLAPLVLIALLITLVITPLWAATAPAATQAKDKSPGVALATTVTAVTGMAISPLLGTGAYGAYQYAVAKKNGTPVEQLPWYAQWTFFVPALALVGACAAKDSLGAVLPPGWKKPLDVLETVENKATGLVAAGAIIPFTMDGLSKLLVASAPAASDPGLASSGLAMIHVGAMDFSWLLNVLTVPFGIAVFAIVWMASHAINVLILLSPWGRDRCDTQGCAHRAAGPAHAHGHPQPVGQRRALDHFDHRGVLRGGLGFPAHDLRQHFLLGLLHPAPGAIQGAAR
jgi:hypothetical protein